MSENSPHQPLVDKYYADMELRLLYERAEIASWGDDLEKYVESMRVSDESFAEVALDLESISHRYREGVSEDSYIEGLRQAFLYGAIVGYLASTSLPGVNQEHVALCLSGLAKHPYWLAMPNEKYLSLILYASAKAYPDLEKPIDACVPPTVLGSRVDCFREGVAFVTAVVEKTIDDMDLYGDYTRLWDMDELAVGAAAVALAQDESEQ